MDMSNITQTFLTPAMWASAVAATGWLAALIWVWTRTGSAHALRHRIWRLLYGPDKLSNETVRNYLDEQTSLTSFRFHSNLSQRVRTNMHAERLIAWLKEHDEDISVIRRMGEYFDIESLTIRGDLLKTRWRVIFHITMQAIGVPAVLLALMLAVFPDAILQIRNTGTWLRLSPESAGRIELSQQSARLAFKECKTDEDDASDLSVATNFTPEEIRLLCGAFAEGGTASYVKKTVQEQRFLAALLGVGAIWLVTYVFILIQRRIDTKRILARMQKRNSGVTTNLSLVPLGKHEADEGRPPHGAGVKE